MPTTARNPFETMLAECQPRIYAFVYSLVGNPELTLEVCQETNVVLVQKQHEFDLEKPFIPWAFAIAKNQIKAIFQKNKRDRLVFSEEALELVEKLILEREPAFDERQEALENCLSTLPDNQKKIVEQKYKNNATHQEIAQSCNKNANQLTVVLFRIRKALADCINRRLGTHHE